jgi:hypothetical protein
MVEHIEKATAGEFGVLSLSQNETLKKKRAAVGG